LKQQLTVFVKYNREFRLYFCHRRYGSNTFGTKLKPVCYVLV